MGEKVSNSMKQKERERERDKERQSKRLRPTLILQLMTLAGVKAPAVSLRTVGLTSDNLGSPPLSPARVNQAATERAQKGDVI